MNEYGGGGAILAGETRNTVPETCPGATLSTIIPTWTGPGMNPGTEKRTRLMCDTVAIGSKGPP
jgi:hypothetical protein